MKILVPDIVVPPQSTDSTEYVLFDPAQPIPEEHLDAEALVVWGLPDALLNDAAERLPGLRLVQMLSAGYDNALRAGFAPEVVISSGSGLHNRPVAEHALALILAAARRLHLTFRAQLEHRWAEELGGIQQEPSPGLFSTLRGARVGIWGFGNIGRNLEPHLRALGATVTGIGRSSRQEGAVKVIPVEELDALLPELDVLVMILPSSPETDNALDARRLALMQSHAWVINVGRGSTIDEQALLEAVRAEAIGGAALDVTVAEPLPAESELWAEERIMITPHAAGGRPLDAAELIERNVTAILDGTPVANAVAR